MQPKSVLASLALLVFASSAPAQHACPDTRASNVAVRVTASSAGTHCREIIRIFGIRISFSLDEICPQQQWVTPGHSECLGAYEEGSGCRTTGTVPVTVQTCTCVGSGGGGIITHWTESCNCADSGTAGTAEKAETYTCADVGGGQS